MYKPKHAKKEFRKLSSMECSKIIMLVAGVTNAIVVLFTLVMVAVTADLSPLSVLIPSVAAEVATGTGFYYSKAKAENKIKLMKDNGVKPSEETFNNYY